MKELVNYLQDAMRGLDIFVETRGDGARIAVANKLRHRAKGKNVFTYWPTQSSVAVIILGLLPRKTYHSVEELIRDKVAEKIKSKYSDMVGV